MCDDELFSVCELTSWWSRRPAFWAGRRCAGQPGWGSQQRFQQTDWCTERPHTWPSVSPEHTESRLKHCLSTLVFMWNLLWRFRWCLQILQSGPTVCHVIALIKRKINISSFLDYNINMSMLTQQSVSHLASQRSEVNVQSANCFSKKLMANRTKV